MTSTLFLVLTLHVGLALDRFAIGNLRRMQKDVDPISSLEPCDRQLHVHLSLAGQKKFLGLNLSRVPQTEIFIH